MLGNVKRRITKLAQKEESLPRACGEFTGNSKDTIVEPHSVWQSLTYIDDIRVGLCHTCGYSWVQMLAYFLQMTIFAV